MNPGAFDPGPAPPCSTRELERTLVRPLPGSDKRVDMDLRPIPPLVAIDAGPAMDDQDDDDPTVPLHGRGPTGPIPSPQVVTEPIDLDAAEIRDMALERAIQSFGDTVPSVESRLIVQRAKRFEAFLLGRPDP